MYPQVQSLIQAEEGIMRESRPYNPPPPWDHVNKGR